MGHTFIRSYHYQREREDIDFILESRAGDLAAIEVKAKASLRPTDWKWLAALRDARSDRFKSGIVIYSGEQTIPLGTGSGPSPTRACGHDCRTRQLRSGPASLRGGHSARDRTRVAPGRPWFVHHAPDAGQDAPRPDSWTFTRHVATHPVSEPAVTSGAYGRGA